MESYVCLDKAVGETPLMAAEAFRASRPDLTGVPLAYAGRLDPMASGKLLILIGDECKRQSMYHGLDKSYEFSILFGISSDTADVLGRLMAASTVPTLTRDNVQTICDTYRGSVTFPYPNFSSKTVNGKPLHVWTLEGRLDEITIPTKTSYIYHLTCTGIETMSREAVVEQALLKINSLPPVTDPRKALGEDFRREPIRADWNNLKTSETAPPAYQIAHFECIASSGTYMRTLATEIASKAHTIGLAYRIHRTMIGRYDETSASWTKVY